MQVLVIGGDVFLGAAVVDSVLARTHRVTVFNRGRSHSRWPAGVEATVGDRSSDLGLLHGRDFDAVVDLCGHVPADLRTSAAAPASGRRYRLVSSIYWPWRTLVGGEFLVPDAPGDEPHLVTDARDLADRIVRAVESAASGACNATGPQNGRACGWSDVLEACVAAARRRGKLTTERAQALIARWREVAPAGAAASDMNGAAR